MEAWLTGPKGIENWAVAPVQITTPRTLQLTLQQDWGEIGEKIAGRVACAGAVLPHERMEVRVLDRRDRVLLRRALAPGELAFTFPIAGWMPMLLRVSAVLSSDNREVTAASAYFHVTQRHQGQFNFVMWDCPARTTAAYAQAAMAQLGVTAVLSGGNPQPGAGSV